MILDRFESISAFVAVADRGGFAAAARALRVSPPVVTRAIAALEARLGARLLHRTTRSVRLTDEGATFLEQCRRILGDLDAAERVVMGSGSEPRGTLVVTAPVVFGRMHVVPIVGDLLARYPELSIRLLLIDRMVQLAEEGIDVALRIGELADSALHATRVGEVRRVLVASPAYLKRHGTPATLADLRRHGIIGFTGLSAGDEWRFGPEGRASAQVRPRLVLNDAAAAIAAAVQDLGIARLLSYQVTREVGAGRLALVLEAEAPPPLPVNLVFQPGRAASPAVRVFLDAARGHLRAAEL